MSLSPIAHTCPEAARPSAYCARCGRIECLDTFGLCDLCRSRPDVIEIDVDHRGRSSMRPVWGPAEENHRIPAVK
jgi:hypothetical protein